MKNNGKLPVRGLVFGILFSTVILVAVQKLSGGAVAPGLLLEGWPGLIPGLLLLFASLAIAAIRTVILLRPLDGELGFSEAFANTLLNSFFSAITPFAAGGQPFQIYDLTLRKVGVSQAAAAVITKFLVTNLATNILTLLFIPRYLKLLSKGGMGGKIIVAGAIITFVIGFLFTVAVFSRRVFMGFFRLLSKCRLLLFLLERLLKKNSEELLMSMESKFVEYGDAMKSIWLKSKKTILLDLLLAFVYLFLNYGIFYAILVSMAGFGNKPVSLFVDSVAVQSLLSYVVYYLPTPGSSGGFEAGMFLLTKGMISEEIGGTVISLWRFTTYHFLIFAGLLVFTINMRRNRGTSESGLEASE